MKRKTKELLAETQLKAIAKELNGRFISTVGKAKNGGIYRTISVEYKVGVEGE